MGTLEDRGIVYRVEWSVGVDGLKLSRLTGRRVWSTANFVEFVVRDCGIDAGQHPADDGAVVHDHRIERWHSTEREAALSAAAEMVKFQTVISAAVNQIYDELGPSEEHEI